LLPPCFIKQKSTVEKISGGGGKRKTLLKEDTKGGGDSPRTRASHPTKIQNWGEKKSRDRAPPEKQKKATHRRPRAFSHENAKGDGKKKYFVRKEGGIV